MENSSRNKSGTSDGYKESGRKYRERHSSTCHGNNRIDTCSLKYREQNDSSKYREDTDSMSRRNDVHSSNNDTRNNRKEYESNNCEESRASRSRSRESRRNPEPDKETYFPVPKKQSRSNHQKPMNLKDVAREREKIMMEHFNYTTENNPFGDENIAQPFVWKKKNAYLKAAGKLGNPDLVSLVTQAKHKVTEIESVKKRREERENEETLLEEQRAISDREREQENYAEYSMKEDMFQSEQAMKRVLIRVDQGREQTLDFLVKSTKIMDGEVFHDNSLLEESPVSVINKMEIEDLRTLHEGLKAYPAPDKHRPYFQSLIVVTENKLNKMNNEVNPSGDSIRDMNTGITYSVLKDVDAILSGRTTQELEVIEHQITPKLANIQEPSGDPSFWEAISELLPLYKAQAEIMRVHEVAKRISKEMDYTEVEDSNVDETETQTDEVLSPELEPFEDENLFPDAQQHSPILIPFSDITDILVVNPIEEKTKRKEMRAKLIAEIVDKRKLVKSNIQLFEDPNPISSKSTGYDEFVRKEQKSMPADEEMMTSSMEVSSMQKHYDWEKKYRPRKPKFFNRVKTGYEWNKYNQTHYDYDNPPPKTVQGYKFNIFYPDLIDKSKTPSWSITPATAADGTTTNETVILTFHSGPPYEDVAFKIVNHEWSIERFRGFRNTYEKGIMQLYFGFKRHRYRR